MSDVRAASVQARSGGEHEDIHPFRSLLGSDALANSSGESAHQHSCRSAARRNLKISPKDFRFYVQSVDLLDEKGTRVPVSFTSAREKSDVIAFLRSLTDRELLADASLADPWENMPNACFAAP